MKKLLLLLAFLASVEVTTAECFHGQVQLLGDTEAQGVVQVCYKGRQAYICPDDSTRWEAKEANTVCTQLGYSSEGANATHECFLVPTVSVNIRFLRFFICNNTASKVTDCYFDSRSFCDGCESTASTTSNERITAAVVQCSKVTCLNDDVRLVGGSTNREGRVEVCMNGQWKAVCGEGWTNEEADLLCSIMGHASSGAEIRVFHPRGVPSLKCQMTISLECEVTNTSECTEDLGVQCLSQQLLQQITDSHCIDCEHSAGALRGVIGFFVIVMVVLVIGWSLSCAVLLKRNSHILSQKEVGQKNEYEKPENHRHVKNVVYETTAQEHKSRSSDPTYEPVEPKEEAGQMYAVPEVREERTNKMSSKDDEPYYHVLETGVYEDIQCEGDGFQRPIGNL